MYFQKADSLRYIIVAGSMGLKSNDLWCNNALSRSRTLKVIVITAYLVSI